MLLMLARAKEGTTTNELILKCQIISEYFISSRYNITSLLS